MIVIETPYCTQQTGVLTRGVTLRAIQTAEVTAERYQGVRHTTGRIARVAARTRNVGAELSAPVDLWPLGAEQTIDFARRYRGPNRL